MQDRIEQLEGRVAQLERLMKLKEINPERLYTPAEAASALACGKTNVYDLIDAGDLAVTRVGAGRKGIRVSYSSIQSFLAARTSGGPQNTKRFNHLKAFLG